MIVNFELRDTRMGRWDNKDFESFPCVTLGTSVVSRPVSRNEGALAFLMSMLGRSFASHWIASSPGTDRSRVDREIASQLFRRKLRNRKLEGG